MKILVAVIAACLAIFLFYQAHEMPGFSLERFGYIGGAVVLIVAIFVLFLPKQDDEEQP